MSKHRLHDTQVCCRVPTLDHMMHMGELLARIVSAPCWVFLHGEVGSGKTTLVRAFLRAKGYTACVQSPSYDLVRCYPEQQVVHADLYRLDVQDDGASLGLHDPDTVQSSVWVEWPGGLTQWLEPDLACHMSVMWQGELGSDEGERRLVWRGRDDWLASLRQATHNGTLC